MSVLVGPARHTTLHQLHLINDFPTVEHGTTSKTITENAVLSKVSLMNFVSIYFFSLVSQL